MARYHCGVAQPRTPALCIAFIVRVARKNKLMGTGRYTWSGGSSYEGGVVEGLRNGHGTFTSADGTLVSQSVNSGRQDWRFCCSVFVVLHEGISNESIQIFQEQSWNQLSRPVEGQHLLPLANTLGFPPFLPVRRFFPHAFKNACKLHRR